MAATFILLSLISATLRISLNMIHPKDSTIQSLKTGNLHIRNNETLDTLQNNSGTVTSSCHWHSRKLFSSYKIHANDNKITRIAFSCLVFHTRYDFLRHQNRPCFKNGGLKMTLRIKSYLFLGYFHRVFITLKMHDAFMSSMVWGFIPIRWGIGVPIDKTTWSRSNPNSNPSPYPNPNPM
jgi:hypothetical protein